MKYGAHTRLKTATYDVRRDIDQSLAKVRRPRKVYRRGGGDRGGGGSENRVWVWNVQLVEEHANNS